MHCIPRFYYHTIPPMLAMTQQTINSRNAAVKLIAIALSLYVIWVATTYILEGRIHLFQKVDPIGRMTYVVIANIAIGTVLSAIAIRYLMRAQLVKPEQFKQKNNRLGDLENRIKPERELCLRYYDKHCSIASK
jgi:hypothetical protein